MTKEEYSNEVERIKAECESALKVLAKNYALSNNPVKIGDLVEDHMRLIRVERFGVRIWNAPQMVYYGKVCKKDGTQMKREKEVCVIQSNIKKINGVSYQCHQPSKLKT